MKTLFKWLFRLVLLGVILIVVLLLSLDTILKSMVQRQIRNQTGMDVKIGKFSFGLLSPVITIEDFKLYNTAEFGGTPFVDIHELHMEYNREAMARRELHIHLLRVDLTEINIVKNDLGGTNLMMLKAKAGPPKQLRADELDFRGIDTLNVSVGKMRFLDLKNRARDRETFVNIQNQIFRNIKTSGDLYGVLIMLWLRSGGGLVYAPEVSPAFPRSAVVQVAS